MRNFSVNIDADNIAVVVFDAPGRSMNTLTGEVLADLAEVVERIGGDPAINGAVITSGKTNGFCAGADLEEVLELIEGAGDTRTTLETVSRYSRTLRELETCGKPVVAAINGLALGGGLETGARLPSPDRRRPPKASTRPAGGEGWPTARHGGGRSACPGSWVRQPPRPISWKASP